MTPPADSPIVLALDVGTSSVRALYFDAAARPIPGLEGRRTYAPRATPDGGLEFDAEELARAVAETLDELLAAGGPAGIRFVACCTFWHSLLGVDEAGKPLTPVYMWGDMRSAAVARALKSKLDERAYHARTGCFFHPLFLPSKLLWHSGLYPEVFSRVARWLSFGEFFYERLFGAARASVSMVSGTGLLNVHTGAYDDEILRATGVRPEQLSPIIDVRDAFRGLRDPFARRWPALRDLPWMPPVGDGACNNLGSGCVSPSRVGVMVGTSGAMRVAWETARVEIPDGLWCYRADRRRVVLGGALNEGGNLLDWCRATFRLGEPDAVERELATLEPDGHGLTVLPFLAGERSTGWVAGARATISGLRLSTRPVEILRAALEAVALRFALIYEVLRKAVPEADEVIASGGALVASPAWVQILADALGRPVTLSQEAEASSRGAALLMLEAQGVIGRLEDRPAGLGRTFHPNPDARKRYQAALERQRDYYRLLVAP